jgi:hypothetical protein
VNAVVKPKRCRTCRRTFLPVRPLQACCQLSCALTYAKLGGEKRQSAASKRVYAAELRENKVEKAERKLSTMTLSKLKNLAQREVNKFVRERDYMLGCISCDEPWSYDGQWTAGHYRTTKAADHLRFNLDNLAKQCGQCNFHKSGNIGEFRIGLIKRIGAARVELLEDDNRVLRWSRDELIAIRKEFLGRWKALKAAREVNG